MSPESVKKELLEHKALSIIGVFLGIILLGAAGVVYQTSAGLIDSGTASKADYSELKAQRKTAGGSGILPTRDAEVSGSNVEVREGNIEINSKNIDQDISRIREIVKEFNGYIESSSKDKGELYTSADMKVRVPSENFESFMKKLRKEFEVKSYNVRNYRLETQRELDELKIINKSLKDYEKIRKQIMKMENSEKKLELLMKVTEKQLELQERRKRYQRQLSDKQQRGDMATVEIELKEKRKVDVMPDNLGNRFKNEVREMLDKVATTLIETFTGGVEIFFAVIKYLIYLGIIAIPVGAAYKVGRLVYKRLN